MAVQAFSARIRSFSCVNVVPLYDTGRLVRLKQVKC